MYVVRRMFACVRVNVSENLALGRISMRRNMLPLLGCNLLLCVVTRVGARDFVFVVFSVF